jgi:serine/threonine protein phosphatase PrpC
MLWVGQFGIVDGQAREESPWVGVFAADGRGQTPARRGAEAEGRADLFVVVEAAAPGSEDYCRDLSRAIGEQFRQQRLSLTGGILRALKAAHDNLRDWNRRSLKQHRVAAGVSCLAVRDSEAYLGQVGPAAAAILRQGGLTRLAPSLPDSLEPLGLHEEFWPDFSRHELAAGDRLLLLSRNLAEALSDDELVAALTPPPEETLPVLYAKAKALANCGAVLVAVLAEPEAVA